MKKRLMASLLAVCLLVSMIPTWAMAAGAVEVKTVKASLTHAEMYDALAGAFGTNDEYGVPNIQREYFDYRYAVVGTDVWYTFDSAGSLPADGTTQYVLQERLASSQALPFSDKGTFVLKQVESQVTLNGTTAKVKIESGLFKWSGVTSRLFKALVNTELSNPAVTEDSVSFYGYINQSGIGYYPISNSGGLGLLNKDIGSSEPVYVKYDDTYYGPVMVTFVGNEYTVTYSDGVNGAAFATQSYTVAENSATPAFSGTPSRSGYAFAGWNQPIASTVTGNVTYSATWEPYLSVKWLNWDNSLLENDRGFTAADQFVPVYDGATPTKRGDAASDYTFVGWDGNGDGVVTDDGNPQNGTQYDEVVVALTDATYVAVFAATGKQYTVTWVNEDGSLLGSTSVAYGSSVPDYEGVAPSKAPSVQYTYEFTGFLDKDNKLLNNMVVSDVTLTADYMPVTRNYVVNWVNWDGTPLETDPDVPYGTVPTYDGTAEPTRPDSIDNDGNVTATWSFIGWDVNRDGQVDAVKAVDGDATYEAVFADSQVVYHTVSFADSSFTSIRVVDGGTVTNPGTPSKDGYTFDSWYADAAFAAEFDFATAIKQDTTVYAKWLKNHTVTFKTDGGSYVSDQTVVDGNTADKPAADPSKSGFVFDGWYADAACTVVYDFATVINQDTTVYAKWLAECTVTFNSNGGTAVAPQTVVSGNTAAKPAVDPSNPGFIFGGWYADAACTVVYDFATVISQDITVYAKWVTDANTNGVADDLETFTVTINVNKPEAGAPVTNTYHDGEVDAELIDDSIYNIKYLYDSTKGAVTLEFGAEPNSGYFLESITVSDGTNELDTKFEAVPGTGYVVDIVFSDTLLTEITVSDEDKTVEVTYGQYTEEDVLDALGVSVKNINSGETIADAEAVFANDVENLDASDEAYPVVLQFRGKDNYAAAEDVIVFIKVNKAAANVAVMSQSVKYGETVADPFSVTPANVGTINFVAGLDAHDETSLLGCVQISMPKALKDLVSLAAGKAGVADLTDLSIEELKAILLEAEKEDDTAASLAGEAREYADTIQKVLDTMKKIQAELPMDSDLRIDIVDALVLPANVGVYAVGSIICDDNYAAPSQEESMDAGYLIITPDGMKATLAWDENDDNYIVTIGKLDSFNFGAHVESVNEGTVAEAESQLDYLFIGVDDDGELLIDRVKNGYGEDVSKVLTQVGVYAQVAYISNWGNTMYYAEPIVRPVLVTPDVANVTIHDASGNENYAQVYTYGDSIDVTVKVDGVAAPVENLRYKWIGSDTTIDGWYRNEAPTDAGVYTLVALYTEKDAEGDLAKAGGAVAVVIIEPADAEVGLNDTTVCPDGAEHFAELTNEALDYITIAIDRENNIAYINIPEDTTAHAERIVTMLPAEIEAKVMNMLNTYASAMEEKVPTSAVKAELNKILDELIAIDLTAEGKAAAEATIEKLKAAVENSEDVKALIAEIKAKVEALESKIRDEIPDNYETKIEEYIRDIVTVTEDNVDIDIDKVKADIKQLAAELEAEGGLPLAVAGVLYKVVDELETALKNNATVNEMTDKVKEIIAELKALDMADAEEIVTKAVGALAGKVDTTELKELVSEVIAKFEALGYVEYTVDLLKDIAGMYKGDLDVDSYVAAVESELNALVDTVKAKVKSGDLQKDDLEAVETYIDNILGKLKVLVDKIPDGTLVFGQNPSEVGEYDCYAMNISANYKPEFVEAKLTIGHVLVKTEAVEPKCEVDGNIEYCTCVNCGKIFDDDEASGEIPAEETVLSALGHDYPDDWTDCEDDENHKKVCANDASHVITESHNWDAGVITKEPTCSENGEKTYTCDDCGAKKVERIPAGTANSTTGEVTHTPAAEVIENYVDSTYTAPGGYDVVVYCSKCGVELSRVHVEIPQKVAAPVQPPVSVKLPMVKNLNYMDHVAYIIGYADGTVDPTGTITRAEVATIYFRLMTDAAREKYWSNTNSFADVADTAWYNVAVSTLANAGVIVDCFDGNFRPNDYITRAELAVLAAQFCSVSVTDVKSTFADVADNYWAADEIALVQRIGWIEGYNGLYRPDDTITRAEAMTIINRMLHRGAEANCMLNGMKVFSDNLPGAWYYEAVQEATNSHSYIRTSIYLTGEDFYAERWTSIQAAPDWAALEKAWADANK